MKVKFFYKKDWEDGFCEIIDSEKYNDNYAYIAESVWEMRRIKDVDYELEEIEKVEKGEIEFFYTGTDIFEVEIYKDRVDFFSTLPKDSMWDEWSCSLEEYKRVLLGKKAFLMLPQEIESYLEIKINDL